MLLQSLEGIPGAWNLRWEFKNELWSCIFAVLIAQCDGHYGVTEDLKPHVVHYIFLLYTMSSFFQPCLK